MKKDTAQESQSVGDGADVPLVAQRSTFNAQPPAIPDHELLHRIGRGSYGEVWLGRNKLGTLRAIKIVYRAAFEDARPFEREFKGIQKFEPISRSHEGLVDILQVGGTEEYFYYVMELADSVGTVSSSEFQVSSSESETGPQPETRNQKLGTYVPRTLRSDLKHHGRLPVAECVRIGLSLASALSHLHENRLVHRDVKPSNIIFVGGAPKLADIGLVADLGEARSFVGTEGFIPPEGPGTPQADLYSLGKVLYELSTGKDRHDFPELPDNLRELPDQDVLIELNAVLVRACATDPRQRYQSAEELHADLALLQRGESVKRKRVLEHRFGILRKIAVVAVVLALLLGALLFVNPFQRHKTPNPEAVRLYELGRWHYNQLTDEGMAKSIEYLNRAIQIDPQFAPAYVALFEIYCWSVGGISDEEKFERVRQIGAKLLAIDPKMAEGHAALAWARFGDCDWLGGEEEIQLAIKLKPNYARAHGMYGFNLTLLGRTEEARREFQHAQQHDPTSRIAATVAGFPFYAARQYDQAIAQFRKALDLDANFPFAHSWIGKALEAQGEYLAAIDAFEKSDLVAGEDETEARQQAEALRHSYTEFGNLGYWRKALEFEQAAETQAGSKKLSRIDRWSLAGIYARLGERDKAISVLEKDFDAGNKDVWLKVEPCYDSLRGEPRFHALLKRVNLSQ